MIEIPEYRNVCVDSTPNQILHTTLFIRKVFVYKNVVWTWFINCVAVFHISIRTKVTSHHSVGILNITS